MYSYQSRWEELFTNQQGQVMTPQQVYKLLYNVAYLDNLQLNGPDKASRIANIYAVKATWIVYNSPKDIIKFTSHLLSYIGKDK